MIRSKATPADVYWRAVEAAHADRAQGGAFAVVRESLQVELLRLRAVADDYRARYFPQLPVITVDSAVLGGRVFGRCSPIGGWGQGVAVTLKLSHLTPLAADQEQPEITSMIWGAAIRPGAAGEALRRLEVELLLLHELVHAAHQHAYDAGTEPGYPAESGSFGGHGSWFQSRCNEIWAAEAERRGLPFAPVRHSRSRQEERLRLITELDPRDQDHSHLRHSCAQWPHNAVATPWVDHPDPSTALIPSERERLERWQSAWRRHITAALQATAATDALVGDVAGHLLGDPTAPPPLPAPSIGRRSYFRCPFDPAAAITAIEQNLEGHAPGYWQLFLELVAQHHAPPGGAPGGVQEPEPQGVPLPVVLPPAEHAAQDDHGDDDHISTGDPILDDVVAVLRRDHGLQVPRGTWQRIAAQHGCADRTVRERVSKAEQLLSALGTPPAPRLAYGDVVALRNQPAVTGEIGSIAGGRANVRLHDAAGNWLVVHVDDLIRLGVSEQPPEPDASRYRELIARVRARHAAEAEAEARAESTPPTERHV